MQRAEDRTQLWWTDGPPRVFQSGPPPHEQVLCFALGGEQLRFDTVKVRPVDGAWECTLEAEGRRFRCTGRSETPDDFRQPVRFVESGPFFQRVIIDGLTFADDEGRPFAGTARLEISAWPDRMAFRLESDAAATLRLRRDGKSAEGRQSVTLAIREGNPAATVSAEVPVTADAALGCHRLALPEAPWSNARGTYYPEEHLDRVDRHRLTLRNDSDAPAVARLMFTQERHLPITGFTPVLCDPDGSPTGLQVQISKNWHRRPDKGSLPHEGTWFHGCAWVRVPPRARRDLVLHMIHARWGGVFAASHAQLCLVGWGHNQFWEQAAVGSFGESICFEPGRVQRRCFITDVRPFLTLSRSPDAKPWGWAENAGGGDCLAWIDPDGAHRGTRRTRLDTRAPGPLLTDFRCDEETRGGEIVSQMAFAVPAATDHLRTFVRLRHDVKQPVRWRRLDFFQLGADFYNEVPSRRVAVGDAAGVRDEWEPRRGGNVPDRTGIPLTGDAAWVSAHGVERAALGDGRAAAGRGLIVRAWRAVLGGRPAAPYLSSFAREWGSGNHRTVISLTPPPDVAELLPGDFVEAELELVVFPANAAAWHGADEVFRAALVRDADTWRPVHREAAGNALRPQVRRGSLTRSLPVVVAVDGRQEGEVRFDGGLGHVPVTFTGLDRPAGHRLLVNGRPADHRQTDWDAAAQRWQCTVAVAPSEARPVEVRIEPAP